MRWTKSPGNTFPPIRFQGGKCQFVGKADIAAQETVKKCLHQSDQGLEYVEHKTYSIFEKPTP